MTKITKHERIAETIAVASTTQNRRDICERQREVTNQLALLGGRIEQFRDLRFAQSLPARHSRLLCLLPGRPSDPGQRVDQSAALDAEHSADSSLGGAAVKRRSHRGELLGVDCGRTAAAAPTATRCGEPGLNPLLNQRSLELGKRPENMKQKLALWCGGVHLLCERTKRDAAGFQIGHGRNEVGKRSTETVELPDDQAIAGLHKRERLGQSHASGAGAADTIFEQMSFVDPAGEERISLQVQGLAITVGGDAHIADEHVRKTPFVGLAYNAPFRQGLSNKFRRQISAGVMVAPTLTEIRCFPSSSKTPATSSSKLQIIETTESRIKSVPAPSPYAYQNAFPLLRAEKAHRSKVQKRFRLGLNSK
jgi:hypothetical protein